MSETAAALGLAEGIVTETGLVGVALTGNSDMAEDLERETCATCNRTFAPSVIVRHAPICAKNAAKAAADKAAVDAGGVPARSGSRTPSSLSVFGDGIDRPLYKVVLTGGPCAGKTTSMVRLTDFLRSRGFRVYIV